MPGGNYLHGHWGNIMGILQEDIQKGEINGYNLVLCRRISGNRGIGIVRNGNILYD